MKNEAVLFARFCKYGEKNRRSFYVTIIALGSKKVNE